MTGIIIELFLTTRFFNTIKPLKNKRLDYFVLTNIIFLLKLVWEINLGRFFSLDYFTTNSSVKVYKI